MPVDAWTPWYEGAQSRPYLIDGDDLTYRTGAAYLGGLEVADFGCGLGWMRRYVPAHLYTGIDGTKSPYADIVADLADYVAPTQGLFMRHVLEHDERWGQILDNAIASFTQRLYLVIYTPLVDETRVNLIEPTLKVPEYHFALPDLLARFPEAPTVSYVGSETILTL